MYIHGVDCDWIDLDTVPLEEKCEQMGLDYDPSKARKEAVAFIHQLTRLSPPPQGGWLAIAKNPHDFGTYLSVRAYYEEAQEEAVIWAFNLEGSLPEYWDEEAKKELGIS